MTTLPPTLLDDALEAEFCERGWVVVPLLSEQETTHLRDFYRTRTADGSQNAEGAYNPTYAEFSVIHSTPEFRADAFREIVDVVGVRAQEWLRSFRPLVANFVNKLPGQGVVPMHQNWSVVDEQQFRSVSVWVALVDCTVENGTLELLAGSHHDFRDPRGMWAYEAFADVADDVHALLDRVEVPAGQAIILDDAVVHYSPPNESTRDRLAIQLIMVPESATPRFFQRVDGDDDQMVVDVWEVEERFFWDFWHGDGDARYGTVVDRIRIPSARVGAQEFLDRYRSSAG